MRRKSMRISAFEAGGNQFQLADVRRQREGGKLAESTRPIQVRIGT
jgi:hypothetical protein